MGHWANTHQLCVVEKLLEGITDMLQNNRLHHSTVTLYATENDKIAVPHNTKHVSQQNEGNIGWSFHLHLCGEGLHLFIYDAEITRTKKVHIPYSCALVTRKSIGISGVAGPFGNIILHGTFTNSKIDDGKIHQFFGSRW